MALNDTRGRNIEDTNPAEDNISHEASSTTCGGATAQNVPGWASAFNLQSKYSLTNIDEAEIKYKIGVHQKSLWSTSDSAEYTKNRQEMYASNYCWIMKNSKKLKMNIPVSEVGKAKDFTTTLIY